MALTMCKPILSVSASNQYEAWANGYNDNPFNRWKTIFQIAVSRQMPSRRHSNSSILYLSSTKLVKYGRTVHLSEASALLFLASFAPDVPIPKLHCAFRDDKKGVTYIVMERIDGQPLSDSWHEASRDEKDRLLTQLRNILEELRTLMKPAGKGIPDGAVCAADGGNCMTIGYGMLLGRKGWAPSRTRQHSTFSFGTESRIQTSSQTKAVKQRSKD